MYVTKKIIAAILAAERKVTADINANARSGFGGPYDTFYSAGLAGEGYDGGYRDALSDVLLVLNGSFPCKRPEHWRSILQNIK